MLVILQFTGYEQHLALKFFVNMTTHLSIILWVLVIPMGIYGFLTIRKSHIFLAVYMDPVKPFLITLALISSTHHY